MSKVTEADRVEVRAELEAGLAGPSRARDARSKGSLSRRRNLRSASKNFDPSSGRERPVEEYLEARRQRHLNKLEASECE